jgi:hypothetical protein
MGLKRSAHQTSELFLFSLRPGGRINGWKKYAIMDIQESQELIEMASSLNNKGFPEIDSLHIPCTIASKCNYFPQNDHNNR